MTQLTADESENMEQYMSEEQAYQRRDWCWGVMEGEKWHQAE